MENASKALLMAAGVLVGILILALMVTLFASSSSLSKSYDEAKQSEAIQQFNSNFTKYLGKDITIHEVVTICNFANKYGVTVSGIKVNGKDIDESNYSEAIKVDVSSYTTDPNSIKTYTIKIISYSDTGYITQIKFE